MIEAGTIQNAMLVADNLKQHYALLRWHDLVNKLNEQQPFKSYARKLKDGREYTITRQEKAINANEKATGEWIIKRYIREYLRLIKKLGESALENGLPGYLTNSVEIGAIRGCSDRTARSHVRKLQKYGLITGYKFHGSRHDFELWISPEILWDPRILAVGKVENQAPEATSLSQVLKNFPHTVTVTHSNKETETDKCLHVEHSDDRKAVDVSKDFHGNPERQPQTAQNQPPEAPGTPQGYNEQRGGGPAGTTAGERLRANLKAPRKPRPIVRLERTDEQMRAIMEGYLTSFWLYAKQILYPGRTFQPYEDQTALNAIRTGVYRDYSYQLTEKQWDQFQAQLYRRIDLAAGYYSRHPDKWIPDPYAHFREGSGYFDWENTRGFRATGAWLKDNQRKYQRNYIMGRISWAIIQLRKHPEGRAQQRLQHKTYIDAYRTLEEMMTKYGEPAVDRFRELASTLGKQKPQNRRGR